MRSGRRPSTAWVGIGATVAARLPTASNRALVTATKVPSMVYTSSRALVTTIAVAVFSAVATCVSLAIGWARRAPWRVVRPDLKWTTTKTLELKSRLTILVRSSRNLLHVLYNEVVFAFSFPLRSCDLYEDLFSCHPSVRIALVISGRVVAQELGHPHRQPLKRASMVSTVRHGCPAATCHANALADQQRQTESG